MKHDPKLLKKLYRSLLRIRMVEEAIAAKYPEQEMRCPVHLSIGQEAVAVGVCEALRERDYLMSGHRAHAHYLAKGGNLQAMIAEIYGKSTGCSLGKGGSMHLVDLSVNMLGSTPIVGGSMPVAVGTAFGSKLKGEDRITTLFFGEGSTEEGVFAECLNFAALKDLPVIFVCENNLYSVYSPLEVRQPANRDLQMIAKGHGIDGLKGDGNKILEVYEKTAQAVKAVQDTGKPMLLEFTTYRWLEHCGPNYDNHIGYRTEEEYLKWKELCPLKQYEELLMPEGLITADAIQSLRSEIDVEIEAAFEFAKASPFPPVSEMARYLYPERANS